MSSHFSRLVLVVIVVVAGCSSNEGEDVTSSTQSNGIATTTTIPAPAATTTVPSATTTLPVASSPVVTVPLAEEGACVRVADGPRIDSFPVTGSVDSVDVSDGCALVAVAGSEALSLVGGEFVAAVEVLPFDLLGSAFFVRDSLWLVGGRVDDCVVIGVVSDDGWHEIVDPTGRVNCGHESGFGPIGVSGNQVIFVRYPLEAPEQYEDVAIDMAVYEDGTWTEYGTFKGLPLGAAMDRHGDVWVIGWGGEVARCDIEMCSHGDAPRAVTTSQPVAIASGDDGDIWLLGKDALSRFDGESWVSYTSGAQIERMVGFLGMDAAEFVEAVLIDLDGVPLDPQPDFLGGMGQAFDLDIGSDGDLWLGVRLNVMDGEGDSLVHVSGDTWTLHPLDDDNFDIVPEMIAIGDQGVWFAHYNTFGDEQGNMAEPHIYRYVPPAE